jgi:trk system potassium uptake protein TrkA
MRLIIIGGNKTVYFLAKQFVQRKYHITIINRDPVRSQELAEQTKATVVLGEGTDVSLLEDAGARMADAVLALTSHDQDNLVVCQIAQRYFGVPRVIAIVNDPDNESVFQKLGVTVAFSPTRIIGAIIDQEASFEDITTLMPLARGRLNIADVRIDAHSPVIGKSLSEIMLTEGSLVACLIRNEEVLVPRGATQLQVNDHLILISHPEHQQQNLVTLCGNHH